MSTPAQILTTAKFANVAAMIDGARAANLPLWIAAAFVERESHGQNIYGHDNGGLMAGQPVTPLNYATFYDAVVNQHHTANGVGPMQITWPGYLVDAKKRGFNLADPRDNFIYGFRLIAGFLAGNYSAASIVAAGKRYNGATAYGQAVAARAAYWHGLLVPAVSPAKASSPVLRDGSTGNAVRSLQKALNRVFPAYSHLVVDGDFGPSTERVIVEFQSRVGITPDGVVGPATRAKLANSGVTF